MKYIQTLLALLVIQTLFGQWEVIEKGNNFDGKFKFTGTFGIGSDDNFRNPNILVQGQPKSDVAFIGLVNMGEMDDLKDLLIQFYFDDLEDIYSAVDILDAGNNIAIISSFVDPKKPDEILSWFELIQMLKEFSTVTFRFKTKTSINDAVFDLKGSSSAISQVVPKLDDLVKQVKETRRRKIAIKIKKERKKEELLLSLKKDGLTESSLNKVSNGLDEMMLSDEMETEFLNIAGLAILPAGTREQMDLYRFTGLVEVIMSSKDGEDNYTLRYFNGQFQIELDSRYWETWGVDDKTRLNIKFLYDFLPLVDLMEMVESKINQLAENSYPKWEISDIVDVKYTINKPIDDVITDIKIRIQLNNEIWINSTIVVTDLQISIDRLKEAGLEPLVEF